MWRKDLDAGLKKKISDWLFAYGKSGNADADAQAKQVLAELQWAPFKKSDNNQLLPIRQMEVNRSIMKLKGDEKVAEAEKAAKLAELQKEFDQLGKQIAALTEIARVCFAASATADTGPRRGPVSLRWEMTPVTTDCAAPPEPAGDLSGVAVPRPPLPTRARTWLLWLTIVALLVVELGSDRDAQDRLPVHRLAQHGGVRRRLPAPELPRLGRLRLGDGGDRADRGVGHGACRLLRHPLRHPGLCQRLPAMDRAACAAADGCLPRHQ